MMISRFINRIINKLGLYDFYYCFGKESGKYSIRRHGTKRIYILTEPEYGNLGDQAIALATELFVKDYFPEYEVIGVSIDDTYKYLREILKYSDSQDIFLLQGGGNMGNLYRDIESARRFCIKHIKQNRLISMPTTITYTNDRQGNRDLKKSKKIYERNQNLVLIARERYSYDFAKAHYTNKVFLVPDIVFYLGKYIDKKNSNRRDFVVALRQELESNLGSKQVSHIIKNFCEAFEDSFIFDTTVSRKVYADVRELEVMSLIHEFQRAKVVLTDRMHGMIMCSITGTPCVAIKSLDNKVIGTYDWIKDLPYIKLNDSTDYSKTIEECRNLCSIECINEPLDFSFHFRMLKKIVDGEDI